MKTQELAERIARLEERVEALRNDIRTLEDKLNGYLDKKIKTSIEAHVGRILTTALISLGTALVSLLAWLLRR